MNETLTALSKWCNVNAMTINTDKTFYQIFTLSHKQPIINTETSNNHIVQTQDKRYLRMYLDGKLTWRNYVKKTVEKLNVLKKLQGPNGAVQDQY
jgi:predicted membrane-bound spermidine synthase